MGLGSFELVTLAEARDAAFANRRTARRDGGPFAERRRPSAPTFAEAAAHVIDAQAAAWKKASRSRAEWESTLAAYAFPVLGDMPVDAIANADVMPVLTPIWGAKRETASRVRQRISAVMRWGLAHGHCADDPAGAAVLQALPHAEVAGAVATAKASDAWIGAKLAFEYIVLTASRSGEIDVEAKAWTIPAERMKAKIEPRVPLFAALPGRPRRGEGPSPNGRGRRSRLPERPRPPTLRQGRQRSPARLRLRSRAARLPRLGVGMHGRVARHDGGGGRARDPQAAGQRWRARRRARQHVQRFIPANSSAARGQSPNHAAAPPPSLLGQGA